MSICLGDCVQCLFVWLFFLSNASLEAAVKVFLDVINNLFSLSEVNVGRSYPLN